MLPWCVCAGVFFCSTVQGYQVQMPQSTAVSLASLYPHLPLPGQSSSPAALCDNYFLLWTDLRSPLRERRKHHWLTNDLPHNMLFCTHSLTHATGSSAGEALTLHYLSPLVTKLYLITLLHQNKY